MGRMEYWDPVTQSRKPAKAGSIVDNTGLEYSPSDVKAIETEISTHKAESATQDKLGHLKLSDIPTGKKSARITIGSSQFGWNSNDVDYLCNGVSDEIKINQAIADLPQNGGEIIILDGEYQLSNKININKNNVSIRGNGKSTLLKRLFNSSTNEGAIEISNVSNCSIFDIYMINGNIETSNYAHGIYINRGLDINIGNCHIVNFNQALKIQDSQDISLVGNICNDNKIGIYSLRGTKIKMIGNTCKNNQSVGATLSDGDSCIISNNICCKNLLYGLNVSRSKDCVIAGNTCNDNISILKNSGCGIYTTELSNSLIANNNNNNNHVGISLSNGTKNTVTSNTCTDSNSIGIHLISSSSNIISSNVSIRNDGLPSDYNSIQNTIKVISSSSHNLVIANNCKGKAVVIDGGTSNTEINNKWN